METITKFFPQERPPKQAQSFLFFDIETTGLSREGTILYLIGCGYYGEGGFHFLQWFNEDGASEREMLLAFAALLEKREWTLVTFNGSSFDLPYLSHHYALHALPNPLENAPSLDLYRALNPFRLLFGMAHGKQKDWERFLGIQREDPYNGGELIEVYKDYLLTKDPAALANLLRHNAEDVLGMRLLLPLLSYRSLLAGKLRFLDIAACEAHFEGASNSVQITAKLEEPLPKPLSIETAARRIFANENSVLITLPFYEETMKHFYRNYRDYYYLPQEDRAIHKSVGRYVERKHRRQAKPSTCYAKKTGIFLPVPIPKKHYGFTIARKTQAHWGPLYRRNYRDTQKFWEFDDLFSPKNGHLSRYLSEVIKEIFIKKLEEGQES